MHKEMSIIKRNKHYLETGEFYEVNKIEIPFYNNSCELCLYIPDY